MDVYKYETNSHLGMNKHSVRGRRGVSGVIQKDDAFEFTDVYSVPENKCKGQQSSNLIGFVLYNQL